MARKIREITQRFTITPLDLIFRVEEKSSLVWCLQILTIHIIAYAPGSKAAVIVHWLGLGHWLESNSTEVKFPMMVLAETMFN